MNEETEPDYDNDLALEYGVSWDLMRRIVYRPAFEEIVPIAESCSSMDQHNISLGILNNIT